MKTDGYLDIEVSEKLHVNLADREPDDVVRTIVFTVFRTVFSDDLAEGQKKAVGSAEAWLFKAGTCWDNKLSVAAMFDAHSQDAVDVFGDLFEGSLFDAIGGGDDVRLVVRKEHRGCLFDDYEDGEVTSLLYFCRMDLGGLSCDETLLVLGRIIEEFCDDMSLTAFLWRATTDRVNVLALNRIFMKCGVHNNMPLYVARGGRVLPHQVGNELQEDAGK